MSHRPTLQRNLAATSQSNPPNSSPDSKHHKPTTTFVGIAATPSHPTQPSKPSFMLKHLSTHLQAKAMSSSAIFDSSKYSLPKPTIEKDIRTTMPARRTTSKEKPIRSSKLQGLLKKKDCNSTRSRSMVEDVKIENTRNNPVVVEEHDDDVIKKRTSVSLAPSTGGRRRSFGGSQVDLGDFFAINGAKMIAVDMPPFMQIHAVDCARKAFDSMEKFTSKTLAFSLKKEFDGVYGPAWHCIVGTGFGSFVTHSVGGFLYFSMDRKMYILLFKTAVQKAD